MTGGVKSGGVATCAARDHVWSRAPKRARPRSTLNSEPDYLDYETRYKWRGRGTCAARGRVREALAHLPLHHLVTREGSTSALGVHGLRSSVSGFGFLVPDVGWSVERTAHGTLTER